MLLVISNGLSLRSVLTVSEQINYKYLRIPAVCDRRRWHLVFFCFLFVSLDLKLVLQFGIWIFIFRSECERKSCHIPSPNRKEKLPFISSRRNCVPFLFTHHNCRHCCCCEKCVFKHLLHSTSTVRHLAI